MSKFLKILRGGLLYLAVCYLLGLLADLFLYLFGLKHANFRDDLAMCLFIWIGAFNISNALERLLNWEKL